jgi:hypothetical protein
MRRPLSISSDPLTAGTAAISYVCAWVRMLYSAFETRRPIGVGSLFFWTFISTRSAACQATCSSPLSSTLSLNTGRTCNQRSRPCNLARKGNASSLPVAIIPSSGVDFLWERIGRRQTFQEGGNRPIVTEILRIVMRDAAITSTPTLTRAEGFTGRGPTFAPNSTDQASMTT